MRGSFAVAQRSPYLHLGDKFHTGDMRSCQVKLRSLQRVSIFSVLSAVQ